MTTLELPVEQTEMAEPFDVPEYDRYEQAALEHINRIRVDILDREPLEHLPPGHRRSSQTCVIAQGIKGAGYMVGVSEGEVHFYPLHSNWLLGKFGFVGDTAVIAMTNPADVSEFVERFDDGLYPHLIKGEESV